MTLGRSKAAKLRKLSPRQLDTIFAALRMWQADVTDDMADDEGIPVDFADIALAHGDALTSAEIDELCEVLNLSRLNCTRS